MCRVPAPKGILSNNRMVCDFFYPQAGGIELHVHQLSQQLINRGHSVIIITHAYGSRTGVRVLTNGLKVYYVPFLVLYRESTFPSVFSFFPILRNIVVRENIDIIHGHGTMSSFCHEAILHGRTMGLKTVFTDHSLFGFADAGSILTNKLLKFTLSDVSHVICVSHTCKENTVLRAALNPKRVSVIPNAVVSDDFTPDPSRAAKNITIIVISRLYSNKGADLLTAIIPRICAIHPSVQFLIAGSGPKEIDLQQMREKYRLQERVELIGSIRHEEVRDVMTSGHIYLHASLTEAFGTVIVEAASCGLLVVTTKVGGIPEVLPSHMTVFASPSADSLVENTLEAISMIENKSVDCSTFHNQIKDMYCWEDIARRTENVYDSIDTDTLNPPLLDRLQRYYRCGPWAGKLFVLCVIVDILVYQFLEWFFPRSSIDPARKWPRKAVPNEKPHAEEKQAPRIDS